MREIVLASGNRGKLAEFSVLLEPLSVTVHPQSALGVATAPETGTTFVENAIQKARHAAAHTGLAALADDSGLVVDALGGAPGVRSARYAGEDASDVENVTKLLAAAAGIEDAARTCRFVCVLAYLRSADDPLPVICTGTWSGHLLRAPRGAHGFGYDPVFGVTEDNCSAAELAPARKHALSHRGLASREMVVHLAREFAAATRTSP